MLNRRIRKFREDEGGFTLIELLVVILIVGILAAIALPTFLGQQSKGQDASAMSNVRNGVTQVESCYTTEQNYTNCTGTNSYEGQPSSVATSIPSGKAYAITATSDSQNTFTITKNTDGSYTRSCTVPAGNKRGACKTGNIW